MRYGASLDPGSGARPVGIALRSAIDQAQQGFGHVKEIDEGIWLAGFMHCDLGYFDLAQKSLQARSTGGTLRKLHSLSYCGEIEKLAAPRNGKPLRKLSRLRRRCPAAITSVAEGEELGPNLLRIDHCVKK